MPRIYVRNQQIGEEAIDVHRHVNNQEYLKWMQEIAIEHSTAQGWPMERYIESGASWYVKSHFIEYLRPAFLGENLTVCTWVADMEKRSSLRRYLFLRSADRQPLARAETRWIFVSLANGRPLVIPEAVSTAFEIVAGEDEVLRQVSGAL